MNTATVPCPPCWNATVVLCAVAPKIRSGALRKIATIRFAVGVNGRKSLECSRLTKNGFVRYTVRRHARSVQEKVSYMPAASATCAYARNIAMSVARNLVATNSVDIVKNLVIWHLDSRLQTRDGAVQNISINNSCYFRVHLTLKWALAFFWATLNVVWLKATPSAKAMQWPKSTAMSTMWSQRWSVVKKSTRRSCLSFCIRIPENKAWAHAKRMNWATPSTLLIQWGDLLSLQLSLHCLAACTKQFWDTVWESTVPEKLDW